MAATRGPRTPPAGPRRGQRLFREGLRGPRAQEPGGCGDWAGRGGASGGGSRVAAPLYYRANTRPLPPPPSTLPARGSESKDGDTTVASGFPSSPNPLPAAQAEPPPPPWLPPRRIESSRSPREAPLGLGPAPYWQEEKSIRFSIGCKGCSSKAVHCPALSQS